MFKCIANFSIDLSIVLVLCVGTLKILFWICSKSIIKVGWWGLEITEPFSIIERTGGKYNTPKRFKLLNSDQLAIDNYHFLTIITTIV